MMESRKEEGVAKPSGVPICDSTSAVFSSAGGQMTSCGKPPFSTLACNAHNDGQIAQEREVSGRRRARPAETLGARG